MSWQVQKRKHGRLRTGVREIKLGENQKNEEIFIFLWNEFA